MRSSVKTGLVVKIVGASVLTVVIPVALIIAYALSNLDRQTLWYVLAGSAFYLGVCALIMFLTLKIIFMGRGNIGGRIETIAAEIGKADDVQMRLAVQMIGYIDESVKESSNATKIVEILEGNIQSLANTSEEMSTSISAVATAAEEISSNINSVANTAEEMSSNTTSVASTTEQMSSNFRMIEGAINEMSKSVGAIADNARNASSIAGRAVERAQATSDVMSRLGSSAKEIGKVTGVIQVIAQQTNLLALNAAIEAASAGEAGKGFAVVANEVKELARQTSTATEDITAKIEGIQSSTAVAIDAIKQISEIITEINGSQTQITDMVERQNRASGEIASNFSQAAKGLIDISRNINESATGANMVSRGISEIATGANDVARNVAETASGVKDIAAKQEEASVLITEATRYLKHTSTAATTCSEGMHKLNVSIDQISEMVVELNKLSGGK